MHRRSQALVTALTLAAVALTTTTAVADGRFDARAITARFVETAIAVPDEIRRLVLEKFGEYPAP